MTRTIRRAKPKVETLLVGRKVMNMAEFDAGGSPAAPYFGPGGREEATAEARAATTKRRGRRPVVGNTVPIAESRGTGVDGGTASRGVDEAGREVVQPQVAGDFDAEPEFPSATAGVQEAAESGVSDGSTPNEGVDSAPGGYDGETQGAKEPEPDGSVTANAEETEQMERNPFEQPPTQE